jgi:tetratricopeptide (TPR) repeat protein
VRLRALGLVALWMALAGAAAPLPLTPPPPDLTKLVPFVSEPLAKPPVTITSVTRPGPPLDIEPIPPARLVLPTADRPLAPMPAPRTLPCAAAWLPTAISIPSEALECGRARFYKGEYDDAIKALDVASRGGDADIVREASYWLAETYLRVGRIDQANALFRQVAQESPRIEQGPWALHGSGWTSLALGKIEAARQAFTQLLAAPVPVPLDSWGRHGQALALYALGRYAEAEQAWSALRTRPVPGVFARDVSFWYGETLGRIGQYPRAEVELAKFAQGAPHPLLDSGLLRRGWWGLAAKDYADSAAAFRAYLAAPGRGSDSGTAVRGPTQARASVERDWADAGLTLALLGSGDWAGVQSAAAALEARRSSLVLPVLLRVVASMVENSRGAEAQALIERLLGGTLTAPVRAWLLFEKGQAYAADGNRDDARTQYELARDADRGSATGQVATFFLARTNFDLREYTEAGADATALLAAPIGDELRAAVLLLQGEAAYQGGDQAAAARSFRRFLVEFPTHERMATVKLALAWTALRQNQSSEALRQFLDFANAYPDHPNAVDALEIASELTLDAGDAGRARTILDQILSRYGGNPRSEFARLNSAILLLHLGQANAALPPLRDWVARAPFPPLLGRAYAALGAALLVAGAPKDAGQAFARAETEGAGAIAVLGRATAALAQESWPEATKALTEARDTGTQDIIAAAEYGLAVVKFKGGALGEFKPVATKALEAAPRAPSAPRLLYVLTGIAVEEKDWPGALITARRLVTQFPSDETADDGLERVGVGAAAARAWPVAYEAWALLRERYPTSPFVQSSAVGFAEAQLQTGRASDALGGLQKVVVESPSDARAWLTLARAREATGDRQGALDGYVRAARESRGPELSQALLGHARLLIADNRGEQARGVLQRLLKSDDRSLVLEAATTIGDTYQRDGDHLAAAEYYMTAAYLEPQSTFGRRALLAAGQSFAALKQPDAAATVYGKLLAQPDVPADVAAAARKGIAALGR